MPTNDEWKQMDTTLQAYLKRSPLHVRSAEQSDFGTLSTTAKIGVTCLRN